MNEGRTKIRYCIDLFSCVVPLILENVSERDNDFVVSVLRSVLLLIAKSESRRDKD